MATTRLSDSEWEVMGSLWTRGRARAREVHDDLSATTGWAYTTVKTLLDRLERKGVLRADREDRSTVYAPLLTRSRARRSALRSLLERAFDGATAPLLRYVVEERGLSRKDRAELLRLLRGEKRKR